MKNLGACIVLPERLVLQRVETIGSLAEKHRARQVIENRAPKLFLQAAAETH
jgi:hypothetical protein